mgnify:CR=1 FL=1
MDDVIRVLVHYVLPFAAAWVINLGISRFLNNERLRGKLHLVFLRTILTTAIYLAAIFVALSGVPTFTRTWEAVLASSGIAAVVLGLAAQSTFSNIFSAISMSISKPRPFDVGDRVRIGDYEPGYVENITLRHTVIKTYHNETLYIPNSLVGACEVINYSQREFFAAPITVSVAYGTDMTEAMSIMADVVASHPMHHGNSPRVFCDDAGESGVLLRVLLETEDFGPNEKARSECRIEIMRRFDEAGIEIPYNKLVVYDGDRSSKNN